MREKAPVVDTADRAAIARWENEGGYTLSVKGKGHMSKGAFRSVLVPIDLTPISDRVVGRVLRLPLADDARVTLLHVVPDVLSAQNRRSAERDATKALASEVRHLRKALPRQHFQPLVKTGAAAKKISACATRVKADLVVMGRGSGRMSDAFLGSTAERVTRQSRVPVLVVRLPARKPYGRPAVALDLDRAAPDSIRMLLHLVPPPRPRVTVIHAFDDPYHNLIYPTLSDAAQERKDELQARSTRELKRLLARAVTAAGVSADEAPPWTTYSRYGSPRSVIEMAMRKTEPDLLVLGTRGHTGVAYAFLGTVAGDVLRQARCDVLVVPPARVRD